MPAPPGGETPDLLRDLWEVSHALGTMSRRMERELGVSGPQRLVLREVNRRPGIAPGELAGVLGVHPSTVTALVNALVRRRLIRRRRRSDDQRSFRLELLPRAEKLLLVPVPTVESVVREATRDLPLPSQQAAAHLLQTVSRALRASAVSECP